MQMTSATRISFDAPEGAYAARRAELKTYFDKTAADAWARLTSDAEVSGIRAKVRAGRDEMRAFALSRLVDAEAPCLLDAGCGPGQLSIEAARRGAKVTAVDLSPTLVSLAEERARVEAPDARIAFSSGDMLARLDGETEAPAFDQVFALDSLIHYSADDMVDALARLAARARLSVVATYAPRTPLLTAKHVLGGLFPKTDRAPEIRPVSPNTVRKLIGDHPDLGDWRIHAVKRVDTGFYVSEAIELRRRAA